MPLTPDEIRAIARERWEVTRELVRRQRELFGPICKAMVAAQREQLRKLRSRR